MYTVEERYDLITKAISLNIFPTLQFDIDRSDDFIKESLLSYANRAMKEYNVSANELYRLVYIEDGTEKYSYITKDMLIDKIKYNNGYEFILNEIKKKES